MMDIEEGVESGGTGGGLDSVPLHLIKIRMGKQKTEEKTA